MIQNITSTQKQEKKINAEYITKPSKQSELEHYLYNLFEQEVNTPGAVIKSYKPFVIKKIAGYLSGKVSTPASVGIVGETASGKSTITSYIMETIESFSAEFGVQDAIVRISTDDYYYDRSEEVRAAGSFAEFAKDKDFDSPDALELSLLSKHIKELLSGNAVRLPKYDMSGTAIRYDDYRLANPSKLIVTEGLFTFTDEVRDTFDFKVYVDIPVEEQKRRFYIRAIARNLGDSVDSMYKNASEKADIYIRPYKDCADIVISGCAGVTNYKAFANKILGIIQEIYFS